MVFQPDLSGESFPCCGEVAAMLKNCPLCNTEMPERYNYCYQCGEYVGHTAAMMSAKAPEEEQEHRRQERIIHYGCLTLIVMWTIFGLWFCVNINR